MKTRTMIPVTATQKTVRDIILSPLPPKACFFAGRSAFVNALMGCPSSPVDDRLFLKLAE